MDTGQCVEQLKVVDMVPDLLQKYNKVHWSIGMKPYEVRAKNVDLVHDRLMNKINWQTT